MTHCGHKPDRNHAVQQPSAVPWCAIVIRADRLPGPSAAVGTLIQLANLPQVGRGKRADEPNNLQREETPKLKSVSIILLAIALGVAAWLLPMRGEQATAQSGP